CSARVLPGSVTSKARGAPRGASTTTMGARVVRCRLSAAFASRATRGTMPADKSPAIPTTPARSSRFRLPRGAGGSAGGGVAIFSWCGSVRVALMAFLLFFYRSLLDGFEFGIHGRTVPADDREDHGDEEQR